MLFDLLLRAVAVGSMSQEPSIGLRDLDDIEWMTVEEAAGSGVMAEALSPASATADMPTMLPTKVEAASWVCPPIKAPPWVVSWLVTAVKSISSDVLMGKCWSDGSDGVCGEGTGSS